MKTPPFLRDILGQDRALGLLTRSAASGRLPHAFLFLGPRGVGKRSTALALARFLLCRDPADDACGRCRSCRKFASLSHPDVQTVAPEGAMIKIDQVRGLQRSLAFPPLEGDLRVSILVRAQTMAAPAANALLKTLEEPPPGNLLVLTAEENEPLLPTILSRCQVVPFAALSDRLVTTILGRGDEDEEDEAAAAELARLAAGSPGLARKLARGRMPELLAETTAAITQGGGPARMFSLAERCARLKDDLPILLQGLYAWTADLARHACGQGHRAGVPLTEEEKALADRLGPAAAAALLSEIDRARGLVARNCNRQAVCELLFMRMASGS